MQAKSALSSNRWLSPLMRIGSVHSVFKLSRSRRGKMDNPSAHVSVLFPCKRIVLLLGWWKTSAKQHKASMSSAKTRQLVASHYPGAAEGS